MKNIYDKSKGISYIITSIIDGKEYIIKIGQSRNTFKDQTSATESNDG